MNISERVDIRLKEAMIKKEESLKLTLRNIKSKLLETVKNNSNQPLTDDAEVKVLEKMIKDRQKSIEMCAGNGEKGDAIAANEQREIDVIKTFLPEKPEQMSTEAIDAAVHVIVSEAGGIITMKDMGRLMNEFNAKYPGQDKKVVSERIKAVLS